MRDSLLGRSFAFSLACALFLWKSRARFVRLVSVCSYHCSPLLSSGLSCVSALQLRLAMLRLLRRRLGDDKTRDGSRAREVVASTLATSLSILSRAARKARVVPVSLAAVTEVTIRQKPGVEAPCAIFCELGLWHKLSHAHTHAHAHIHPRNVRSRVEGIHLSAYMRKRERGSARARLG